MPVGAHPVGDLPEEQAVATEERFQDRPVERGGLHREGVGQQQRGGVGQMESDPAVLARQRARAGPEHLSGGGQLVQHGRVVVGHPGGQDQPLQGGGGHGGALELFDGAQQPVDPAQPAAPGPQVLPLGQERGERGGRHRLQLLAQRGQGAAAQPPQHTRVAPLLLDPRGMELALDHPAGRRQPVQRPVGDRGAQTEPPGGPRGGERAVGAGVAAQQVAQRVGHGLGEGLGHADGQRRTQRVAQPPGVLDRRPVLQARDTDADGAAGVLQLPRPPRLGAPLGQFRLGERAQQAQHVGDALGVLDPGNPVGPALAGEPLQLALQLGQHLGVE